jgi:uncharacterized protein (TIGR02099 family)
MRAQRLFHHRRLLVQAARAVASGAAPYAALALAVAALLLGGSRVLLGPALEGHPEVVAGWLAQAVGHPVTIDALRAGWRGWRPRLSAEGLAILGQGGEPAVRLRRIDLEIDPLGTLLAGAVRVGSVRMDGLALALVREADGTVALRGFGDAGAQVDLLPALLSARSPVELARSTLVWEDRGRGLAPVVMSDVTLALRNAGDRHHLQVGASLPGGRIRLLAETRGDLLSGAWDGTTYLEVQGLGLARWVRELAPGAGALHSGAADLGLWVQWQSGRVQGITGRLDARQVSLELAGVPVNVTAAQTRFKSRRLADGWHLTLADLRVASDLGLLEAPEIEVTSGPRIATGQLVGFAERLRVEPPDPGTQPAAPPRASLRDLRVSYDPRLPGLAGLRLSASLERLDWRDPQARVELRGLAGQISAHGRQVRLRLAGVPVSAQLPRVFSETLAFTRATGTLDWQLVDGRWLLSSPDLELENADLRLALAGRLAARTRGDPDLYLSARARLEGLDLQALARYLPDRAMKPRAHAWLVRALRRGQVTGVDLLLHGPLAEVPFHRASGVLEADVELSGVELDYRPPWPAVRDAQASLSFRGPGLAITVAAARMLDSPIGETRAEIADLGHEFPVLTLQGTATPSGADALRLVRESPLDPAIKRRVDDLEVDGPLDLDLDLVVPLAHDDLRVTEVEGAIGFRGNPARLRGVEFSQAQGRLGFTRERFVATGLRASLAGMPVDIGIEPASDDGRSVTRLRLAGTASPAQLADSLGPEGPEAGAWKTVAGRLHGTFRWQATATVPADERSARGKVDVVLASDLRGLAVDLPLPLGKGAAQARDLEVQTTLGGDAGHSLRLRYGEEVAATVLLGTAGGRPTIAGAHVQLGAGARPPAGGAGRVSLVGELDTLPAGAWGEVLGALGAGAPAPRGRSRRALPVHVDLTAGTVDLATTRLERVSVVADFAPATGWRARLEGDGARGQVRAAPAGSAGGVTVELEHLALVPIAGATGGLNPPDPRGFPAVEFRCADFSFDGRSLGKLAFSARPTGDGLAVSAVRLEGPLVEVEAGGHWEWSGGDQRSRFRTTLTSPDLGKLLEALGYDQTGIQGGRSRMEVEASWPGAPPGFSLAAASGRIQLKVEDGMLSEVEPGAAGRIFGLLSIQALPRRLTLDFRDLFARGLRYDRIEGSFVVADGNAHTRDLVVEGGAARIEVTGRVGLDAQDYDQVVTVTPRVSTTLPVAGAIAGGPAGAVAGLLAQGLLREQIDRAAASRYTVKGSWADPQVGREGAPAPSAPE